MVPTQSRGIAVGRRALAGHRIRAPSTRTGDPFLEMDLVYGEPSTKGRSRTPYDAFGVRLRFGGGGTFSEARVRGRLLGQPLGNERFQLNILQDYDFNREQGLQFGAQSFEVNTALHRQACRPASPCRSAGGAG